MLLRLCSNRLLHIGRENGFLPAEDCADVFVFNSHIMKRIHFTYNFIVQFDNTGFQL